MSDSTSEFPAAMEAIRAAVLGREAARAVALAEAATQRWPSSAEAYNLLGSALMTHERPAEAEQAFRTALTLRPDYPPALANLGMLLTDHDEPDAAEPLLLRAVQAGAIPSVCAQLATLVPPLPDSVEQIDRQRYMTAGRIYLAYHGRNDRDLQREPAALFAAPQPALPLRARRGFVSALSRRSLPLTRQAIVDQALDVLFFADASMERIMYTLAMSRMAPIQCTTWGNPVTTGIATADYFISAEALETLASDGHYTERLVRLKSLAVRYERPPRVPTDRAKFGFDKDSGSTSARRRRTSSMPSEFLRG